MGSYVRDRRRWFGIREKGWAFDPQGNPGGSFGFAGTDVDDDSGMTLTGGGTYTLHDLARNAIFVETLTVTGNEGECVESLSQKPNLPPRPGPKCD